MRKTVMLSILLCAGLNLMSQDLIVTIENDSINARITKENKKTIYFDFMKAGEVKSTLLMRSQVANYQKGFFMSAEVPKNAHRPPVYEGERFRLGAEAGVGFRLGRLPSNLDPTYKDYLRKLKFGVHWGVDAHYFISETVALGGTFSAFRSANATNYIQTTFPDGSVEQGLDTKVNINFIGPSFLTRYFSANKKNALIGMLGVGYLNYSYVERAGARTLTQTGSTLGITSDLGYEIGLNKTVSIGIAMKATLGSLNKLNVDNNGTVQTVNLRESGNKPESLNRYDLYLGVRVYL